MNQKMNYTVTYEKDTSYTDGYTMVKMSVDRFSDKELTIWAEEVGVIRNVGDNCMRYKATRKLAQPLEEAIDIIVPFTKDFPYVDIEHTPAQNLEAFGDTKVVLQLLEDMKLVLKLQWEMVIHGHELAGIIHSVYDYHKNLYDAIYIELYPKLYDMLYFKLDQASQVNDFWQEIVKQSGFDKQRILIYQNPWEENRRFETNESILIKVANRFLKLAQNDRLQEIEKIYHSIEMELSRYNGLCNMKPIIFGIEEFPLEEFIEDYTGVNVYDAYYKFREKIKEKYGFHV